MDADNPMNQGLDRILHMFRDALERGDIDDLNAFMSALTSGINHAIATAGAEPCRPDHDVPMTLIDATFTESWTPDAHIDLSGIVKDIHDFTGEFSDSYEIPVIISAKTNDPANPTEISINVTTKEAVPDADEIIRALNVAVALSVDLRATITEPVADRVRPIHDPLTGLTWHERWYDDPNPNRRLDMATPPGLRLSIIGALRMWGELADIDTTGVRVRVQCSYQHDYNTSSPLIGLLIGIPTTTRLDTDPAAAVDRLITLIRDDVHSDETTHVKQRAYDRTGAVTGPPGADLAGFEITHGLSLDGEQHGHPYDVDAIINLTKTRITDAIAPWMTYHDLDAAVSVHRSNDGKGVTVSIRFIRLPAEDDTDSDAVRNVIVLDGTNRVSRLLNQCATEICDANNTNG